MKIAFLVTKFPCLSETFILNQITGLLDRGHRVDIFSKEYGDDEATHPDVQRYGLLHRTRYVRIPSNKLFRILGLPLIARHFHKNPKAVLAATNVFAHGRSALSLELLYSVIPFLQGYDIIHCQFGTNGNLGVAIRGLGVRGKLVTTFHGHDIRSGIRRGGQIYRRLFDEGDCFIAISAYNSDNLIKLGLDERKIVRHPVGIDLRQFPHTARSSGNSRILRLITVARLVEEKGLEYGVQAVHRLMGRHPYLKIRYDIVGGGPLRSGLARLVQTLGMNAVVRMMGPRGQPEVLQLLQDSDIFLLPSVAEALPVALMESQAVGLPVIATATGSTHEIVLHGESGLLVPPGDVAATVEGLEYLLQHRPRWCEMGRAGRKHIEENFDVDRLNDRLVGIYRQLIAGRALVELRGPAN